jgi:hypothetical protein
MRLDVALTDEENEKLICASYKPSKELADDAIGISRGERTSKKPYTKREQLPDLELFNTPRGAHIDFEKTPLNRCNKELLAFWLFARGYPLPSGALVADLQNLTQRIMAFPEGHPSRETVPIASIRSLRVWEAPPSYSYAGRGTLSGDAILVVIHDLAISIVSLEVKLLPPAQEDPYWRLVDHGAKFFFKGRFETVSRRVRCA